MELLQGLAALTDRSTSNGIGHPKELIIDNYSIQSEMLEDMTHPSINKGDSRASGSQVITEAHCFVTVYSSQVSVHVSS